MAGRGSNKGAQFTKLLRINSSNRVNPTTTTDTNFDIDLGPNLQLAKQISILAVEFPNNFYNVFFTTTKFNNYIKVTINDATPPGTHDYLISVPPGFYSVYTLYAAVSAAVSAATAAATTVAFSFNATTNLVTATWTPAVGTTSIVTSNFSAVNVATVGSGRQDYNTFGLLGFINQTWTAASSTPWSSTATLFPSLGSTEKVYITSSALSPMNSFDEKGQTANVLVGIQNTAPFGGISTFECQQDILCEVNYGKNPRALNRIDIQLVDHDGDILDLHGGQLNLDLRVWLNMF